MRKAVLVAVLCRLPLEFDGRNVRFKIAKIAFKIKYFC